MSSHIKRVKSKEIDINRVKFVSPEELDKIKTDKRVLAGCIKNLQEIIVLSADYNSHRNVPTIDLRTFAQDRNTGEMVPTKAGFRLDPSQYSILLTMLNDNNDLIEGSTGPDTSFPTDQSNHLLEQIEDEHI